MVFQGNYLLNVFHVFTLACTHVWGQLWTTMVFYEIACRNNYKIRSSCVHKIKNLSDITDFHRRKNIFLTKFSHAYMPYDITTIDAMTAI